jgi:hypothetical protein
MRLVQAEITFSSKSWRLPCLLVEKMIRRNGGRQLTKQGVTGP